MSDLDQPLWRPGEAQVSATHLWRFMNIAEERFGVPAGDYEALWSFSIDDREAFWDLVRKDAGLRAQIWGQTGNERVLVNGDRMPGASWYPDARLNYAENLLVRHDNGEALVFRGEDKVVDRLTWAELHDRVSVFAQALSEAGVGIGDRVAGYLPNMPETIIAMLATSAVGATWSSCSPDFGVQGVLDRFGQIKPKILVTVDGYFYKGKRHDLLARVADVMARLPSCTRCVIVPYATENGDTGTVPKAETLADFTADFRPATIAFEQLPFDHPLFIMFSSGTTGEPKCIVHGQGGTLLQHVKEHRLHSNILPDDRVFYFTTCGWMMWNWLASALAQGSTLLLYDGDPFYPDGKVLWDFAATERCTFFGTSAKYIDALSKAAIRPNANHDLRPLRTLASTGSPLAPEGFDYVYEHIKPDLHLASIAGGTDIISCFMLGDPTGPVWRGEIQRPGLGMAVDVFSDDGMPIRGEKGELVCTRAFPSMPTGFWNDEKDVRYRATYFERFDNTWHHGDFVTLTERGGLVMFGRSDATLNPGGVRIGTAEIYRQVERLDEVVEALVIGQDWQGDVRIVLFVRLRGGIDLDDSLTARIRKQIRDNNTPRHVPAKIVAVADIPRTKSGKITELAVRDVVHGRPVNNREALANPDALALYADIPELQY